MFRFHWPHNDDEWFLFWVTFLIVGALLSGVAAYGYYLYMGGM